MLNVGFAEVNKSDIGICSEQRRVIMPTPSGPLRNRLAYSGYDIGFRYQ